MKRSPRRGIAAVTALVSMSLALASCASADLVAQSADTVPQSGPAIDTERATALLADLEHVIAKADETRDVDLLATRLTEPALGIRKAQYALAEATGGELEPIVSTAQSLSVTDTQTWPRAMLNISEPKDNPLPGVEFLVQTDPRAPYKLHSWTHLLGGTEFSLPNVSKGSKTLVDDSPGFVKTPREALDAYVELLNSKTTENSVFTKDEFTTRVLDDAAKLNDAAKNAGSVEISARAGTHPTIGVVLEDGSALVSAPVNVTLTYRRTVARSTLRLGGTTADLNPGAEDKVEGAATVTYTASVLLKIPSAIQGGPIRVVGAEKAIAGVTLDPSSNPDNAG